MKQDRCNRTPSRRRRPVSYKRGDQFPACIGCGRTVSANKKLHGIRISHAHEGWEGRHTPPDCKRLQPHMPRARQPMISANARPAPTSSHGKEFRVRYIGGIHRERERESESERESGGGGERERARESVCVRKRRGWGGGWGRGGGT